MIDVESAAQNLIDAKSDGQDAVKKQFGKVTGAVIEHAKTKMPPGSELSDLISAMSEADDYLMRVTARVCEHGIFINDGMVRQMVSNSLTKHRQTSPLQPNWTPRGRVQ